MEKPNVGSPFFGAFLSEGFLKVTKEINEHLIPVIYASEFRGIFFNLLHINLLSIWS